MKFNLRQQDDVWLHPRVQRPGTRAVALDVAVDGSVDQHAKFGASGLDFADVQSIPNK